MKASRPIVVRILYVVLPTLLAAGCAKEEKTEPAQAPESKPSVSRRAAVTLEARSGSGLTGTATFTAENGTVTLDVRIANVKPGLHAMHIHEHGDCSAPDAMSAGGHWNPANQAHGKWGVEPFHLGDIGNIEVGADGQGAITLTTDRWTLGDGASTDIAGKSVIIHADPDDFKTQPTGNAGARIGCGKIEVSQRLFGGGPLKPRFR